MTDLSRAPSWRELDDLPFAASLAEHTGGVAAGCAYETVLFDGLSLDEPDVPDAAFTECALRGVSASGGSMRRVSFRETWVCDLRLTGTTLAESRWLDVMLSGAVLAGTQAYRTGFNRVSFTDSKLEGVNFRGSRLTDVTFVNCVLRDVDFAGATLTRTSFSGSQLSAVDMSKVTMVQVDLRDAELGLIIDESSLRGSIIGTAQLIALAPTLAQTLGVTVSDDRASRSS